MPGGDGSGPRGMGSMTGRAAGYCAGYQAPGFANAVPGRGFGYGRGMGYGYGRGMGLGFRGGRGGRWGAPYAGYGYNVPYAAPYAAAPYAAAPYAAAPSKQQELDALKGQAEYFENALADIRARLDELASDQPEK